MNRKLTIEKTGWLRPDGKRIPKIRISGQWLAALGFVPGCVVLVQPTAEGQIMLTMQSAQ